MRRERSQWVGTLLFWTFEGSRVGGQVDASPARVAPGNTVSAWRPPPRRNRAEREATGDPRLSLEERYPSREAYLDRVRQAAEALAREGYLLTDDVPLSVAAGARLWDHSTR